MVPNGWNASELARTNHSFLFVVVSITIHFSTLIRKKCFLIQQKKNNYYYIVCTMKDLPTRRNSPNTQSHILEPYDWNVIKFFWQLESKREICQTNHKKKKKTFCERMMVKREKKREKGERAREWGFRLKWWYHDVITIYSVETSFCCCCRQSNECKQ